MQIFNKIEVVLFKTIHKKKKLIHTHRIINTLKIKSIIIINN